MTIGYLKGDNRPTKTDAVVAKVNEIIDLLNAGGGGGISEITSNDLSVTVTNPTGPTADLSASGGSQTLCYEVTVGPSQFPNGGEIVPTGLELEVGDRVIDVAASIEDGTTPTDFLFGNATLSGVNKLSGMVVNGNDPNDGGPYSGDRGAGHFYDLANAEAADVQGRLPCTVLVAHELMVTTADAIEDGSVTFSIYVIRAAEVEALAAPAPSPAITSYTPDTGAENDPVVIHGTGFTGATAVLFNTVSVASFVVDSDIQITTDVPAGATTGQVRVDVGSNHSGTSPAFTVT